MDILRVVLFMLNLAPSRGDSDIAFRFIAAEAIVNTTPNVILQDTLSRIIWKESNFRIEVADCRIKGDNGKSMGLFQIQPRTDIEKTIVCGSISEQTELAFVRINESIQICHYLPESERLGIYTDGSCDTKKAKRQSRERWAGTK